MDPYLVLPILSAVTMLAASEITAKNVDPQQRWLMRIVPIGITAFIYYFPAGLFMYWITSNLVTLLQNYLIYNHGPGKKSPPEKKQREPDSTNSVSKISKPAPDSQAESAKPEQQKAKSAGRRRKKRKR
jgi:YidC/Oxa1 family membrane protein insertase